MGFQVGFLTGDIEKFSQEMLTDGPQPGDLYRHFKGGLYVVICNSIKEDTLEHLVTYRSVARGFVWTRTLTNWQGVVGDTLFARGGVPQKIKRFERVTE